MVGVGQEVGPDVDAGKVVLGIEVVFPDEPGVGAVGDRLAAEHNPHSSGRSFGVAGDGP